MRVLGNWISILLVGCAVLARASSAQACGALPYAYVRDVQPADGAAGVPLNTELRIRYFGAVDSAPRECEGNLTTLRLTPAEGEPQELDGELLLFPERAEAWLKVSPPEPLLPQTRYELELRSVRDDICADGADWTVVASFETGAGPDLLAPELTGSAELSYGDRESGTTNCGATDGVPVVTVLGLADDSQGARYNVYVNGELTSPYRDRVTATTEGAELLVNCGTTALSTATLLTPGAQVEIRAVDLAGNESPAGDSTRVADRCNPGSGSDASGGCSAAVPRAGAARPWLFAVLGALAARATRGRRRSRP